MLDGRPGYLLLLVLENGHSVGMLVQVALTCRVRVRVSTSVLAERKGKDGATGKQMTDFQFGADGRNRKRLTWVHQHNCTLLATTSACGPIRQSNGGKVDWEHGGGEEGHHGWRPAEATATVTV